MANERFYQGPYCDNLGISYSAGTFTIKGCRGLNLSAANPAYIVLPSVATPGLFTKYTITANQDFIDDAGSSEIVGNLFGYTTAVAITVDVPFFIYAVANDAETSIAFMLSRQPHRRISPIESGIGAPDDAVADTEQSFWSLENLDETLYDVNPCLCIGSFRMRMSASDDWTVQAFTDTDGIGQYQESVSFTQPLGQFGANASTLTLANGGTAPVFTTTTSQYFIKKDGICIYNIFLSGDAGTDGSGAVTALITTPYLRSASTINTYAYGTGHWAAGTSNNLMFQLAASNTANFNIQGGTAAGAIQWAAFTNGARQIAGSFQYQLPDV